MVREGVAALLAFVVATFAASGADACTKIDNWPRLMQVSPAAAADAMVSASTYVDLAVVEKLTPDFELGTRNKLHWVAWSQPGETVDQTLAQLRGSWGDSVRIHYRVLINLKAQSSLRFDISGLPEASASRSMRRRFVRLSDLKYFLDQQDLAAWPGVGACTEEVPARLGGVYLIFRDAHGYLLRATIPVTFDGKPSRAFGPADVPVGGLNNAWVGLVRQALAHRKS